jgi:hypothetical protein
MRVPDLPDSSGAIRRGDSGASQNRRQFSEPFEARLAFFYENDRIYNYKSMTMAEIVVFAAMRDCLTAQQSRSLHCRAAPQEPLFARREVHILP